MFIITSNFVFKITENIYDLALPLLVLYYTGSPILMGLMYSLGFFAEFIVSYFGGTFIDRFDRKKLLVTITVSQAISISLLPVTDIFNFNSIIIVFIIAFIVDVLISMYALTELSIIPQLVSKEELPKANGYMQIVISIALAIGPAIAGLLIELLTPQKAMWISAFGFVLLIGTLQLVKIKKEDDVRSNSEKRESIFISSKKGLLYTVRNETFKKILIWNAFINLGLSGSILMLVFHFTETMHYDAFTLGIIMTFAAVGGILSGILLPKVQATYKTGSMLFTLSIISGISLVCISLTSNIVVTCFFIMLLMVTIGINSRLVHMLFQSQVPADMLGKVMGTSRLISTILAPISVLVSGWIAESFSSNLVFLIGGSIILLTNVVILSTDSRNIDWRIATKKVS